MSSYKELVSLHSQTTYLYTCEYFAYLYLITTGQNFNIVLSFFKFDYVMDSQTFNVAPLPDLLTVVVLIVDVIHFIKITLSTHFFQYFIFIFSLQIKVCNVVILVLVGLVNGVQFQCGFAFIAIN